MGRRGGSHLHSWSLNRHRPRLLSVCSDQWPCVQDVSTVSLQLREMTGGGDTACTVPPHFIQGLPTLVCSPWGFQKGHFCFYLAFSGLGRGGEDSVFDILHLELVSPLKCGSKREPFLSFLRHCHFSFHYPAHCPLQERCVWSGRFASQSSVVSMRGFQI